MKKQVTMLIIEVVFGDRAFPFTIETDTDRNSLLLEEAKEELCRQIRMVANYGDEALDFYVISRDTYQPKRIATMSTKGRTLLNFLSTPETREPNTIRRILTEVVDWEALKVELGYHEEQG